MVASEMTKGPPRPSDRRAAARRECEPGLISTGPQVIAISLWLSIPGHASLARRGRDDTAFAGARDGGFSSFCQIRLSLRVGFVFAKCQLGPPWVRFVRFLSGDPRLGSFGRTER